MASPAFKPEPPRPPVSMKAAAPSELPSFLDRVARIDREFIVYDNGWRGWTYSYAGIAGMAGALAARFRAQGINKGDTVLLWSESRPGWVAALWACLTEGIVLVPVDPQSSSALFHRIEQKVKPRIALLGEMVAGMESSRVPVWRLQEIETAAAGPPHAEAALNSDDIAEIVFTSGTTAEPKGVLMTHRNLAASLRPLEEQVAPYRKYFRLLSPLRVLNLLPLSHLFGQAIAMFLAPLVPASVVFLTSAGPDEIARQIRSRRICALVSVPKVLEVLRDLIQHRFPETRDLSSVTGPWPLRWWRFRSVHRLFGWRFCCFIVGGAPLAPDLEEFWSKLSFVVAQGYGLTETAPIISFSHPFHVQEKTAGKPIAGVQIRIADDGEVLVRGDNVTPGYFQAPAETAAAFQDGWFRTGDIGELGPEGELVIRGRKKELIVTPEGLKVFPDDVESVLNRIDGVRESAVIGREGVHAVLALEPGIQGEEVVRLANQQLEPHQRVRSFSVWTHGDLPRTRTTHKLRRAEIVRAQQPGAKEPERPETDLASLVRKYAPGRTITPDTTLEELGLSSLDRVELMMDLEEKLATSIDESAFASVTTVADLSRPMAAAKPFPQPAYNRTWPARALRRILLPAIFLPFTKIFAHMKVTGRENLEGIDGPAIYVANHQSHLDTPVVLAALSRRLRYQVAPAMWKEYFDAHFFPEQHSFRERWTSTILYRLVTTLFNAFPIPQVELGTRQALRYMGELVEEGWSVLIFPEGERTQTGEIGKFFPGVGIIAARMHLPVVPIRLEGLDRVLPRHARWPKPGPVEVRIGSPFVPAGESYAELAKQVELAVRSL